MNAFMRIYLMGVFLSAFLPQVAFSEDEKLLEEVIVSAERTEQSLLEIPVSVSVFDTEMLENYNITSNKDLEVRTPGLQFGLDSPTTIRGIGAPLHRAGLDLSVAQYSNDLYFREQYGVVGSMFDMDRVEVLRGPQGTLYGRNSIGGAINYINKRPEWESSYGITSEVTNFSGRRLGLFVTGPFNEFWAYRLTGEWQESDGMQKNISGPDGNSRGNYSIAPQIAFNYGKWEMNLRYANFDADREGDQRVDVTYQDTTVEFHAEPQYGLPSGERNQYYKYPRTRPPANDGGDLKNIIDKNRTERNTVTRNAVNFHLGYEINDNWKLRYIYGNSNTRVGLLNSDFDNSSVVGSADNPYVSANAGVPFQDGYIDAWFFNDIETQELQLTFENDRVFAMFGLYDLSEGIGNDFNVFDLADPLVFMNTTDIFGPAGIAAVFGSDPASLGPGVQASSYVSDGSGQWLRENQKKLFESKAAFAQVNISLNDKLSLIVGARYTDDDKTTLGVETFVVGRNGPFPFPARLDIVEGFKTLNFTKTTGNITLEYARDDNQFIYGRLATGYKAGAIVAEREPPLDTVDPEELTSLELGYKADLLDDRLRVLVSGFIYDFDNYQQIIYTDVLLPVPRNIPAIQNVPGTDVRGLEIEGTYFFTENFSVRGFVALTQAELGRVVATENRNPQQEYRMVPYTDLGGNQQISYLPEEFDFTGNDLPQMPNEKFSITGDYTKPLTESDLRFSLSYSWTGKRHSRISNLDKDRLAGFGRWDGSITWSPRERDLEVSLLMENMADEIGMQELESITFSGGYAQNATLTNPRYYGLVVRWVN